MKIGLYFGTFNPIHVGHLVIANYMADYTDLDQVWLVVSPQNPLKVKSSLLADYHRLAIVQEAVEDNPKLKASDIEFHLNKPSYTSATLAHLKEKYPNYEFSLIMGEDNLRTLHKWYKGELSHSYLPTLKIDNYFYSNLSNDKGKINVYQIKVFMTKQQWRDYNLENILNG